MDSSNPIETQQGAFVCNEICNHAHTLQELYYWENQLFLNTELTLIPFKEFEEVIEQDVR